MANIGKPQKPTDSEKMSPNVFGKEVVLLVQAGYNPSEIIGTSASGRSKMKVINEIKEFLDAV